MNKYNNILNSFLSKKSVNTDGFIKISIDGKEKLLPPSEINNILYVNEQFNKERQESKKYRIIGTINPIMSNVLFNINDNQKSDLYTWAGFNYRNPLNGDYRFLDRSFPKDNDVTDENDLSYQDVIKEFLKEKNGWFGYFDPDKTKSSLCNFFDMEPKRERFSFSEDYQPYNGSSAINWYFYITYPKYTDGNHYMVNGGLLLIDDISVNVSNRNMVALTSGCKHNLSIGDSVRISGTNGYDGDFNVVRTGLDNGDLKEYYFVIDIPLTSGGGLGNNSRFKKVVAGEESKYYFRVFEKVKIDNNYISQSDYDLYKLAFSENCYSDEIHQIIINNDIDITDLTDNLGRPLSELYLTILKTDSNGLFSNISSGIEIPFIASLKNSNISTQLLNVPVINRIHNGGSSPFTSHIPLEVNITNINNLMYGDLVEYNRFIVKETVLCDVAHRFNTVNRENTAPLTYLSKAGETPRTSTTNLGPRQEGYYYKPHNLIRIRDFSNYIEQGDSTTEGIPDYAEDLGDGRFLWRDLLDIGLSETSDVENTNYPFLNGCHYMYDNYCFLLKRQDPFGDWGLLYTTFPSDPLGDTINDNFTVKGEEDVC